MRLGRVEEAVEFSVEAAARPNAHAHILAVTAFLLTLHGRLNDGRSYVASIQETRPHYGVGGFLRAYQFTPQDENVFRDLARRRAMG